MKEFVPDYDKEKMMYVLSIGEALEHGELTLEEARAKLRERVSSIKPYEIAMAEQELQQYEDDQCEKKDIQAMLDLYEGLIDKSRPELPEDHPIARYYQENDKLREIIGEIRDLIQYPVIRNQWYALYDRLSEYRKHLTRKQMQLYPVLEQKGFDRPTTTMWTLDDFIRDEISDLRGLLEQDEEKFITEQHTLIADLEDLMYKEESVLYPTSLAMISPEEFRHMSEGDTEIGFAWRDIDKEDKPVTRRVADAAITDALTRDLMNVLAKHGVAGDADAPLRVTTGEMTLEQINLVFQNLPMDITYVDENEIVKFYSDTDHRIFPRSKNVIGRKVTNCHPRKSVHIVEEIVEKFRSGEQDHAEFWINKPDLFIYIYYKAVRDGEGKFRGILEVMQDCTRIRQLQDSQTLLSWHDGNREQADDAPEDEAPLESESNRAADQETVTEIGELTPQTKLSDLLAVYPQLKGDLPKVDGKFKALQTPLARIMIPKATIAIMAERTGRPVNEILEGIRNLIAGY